MTSSSEITIAEVAAMATVGATVGLPVGVTGGGQVGTVLGGLAGVSPVLAGAYLGYLVVRMLIRAGGARVLGAEPQARTAAGKAMTDGSRSCSTRWRAPRGRSTRGQTHHPTPRHHPPVRDVDRQSCRARFRRLVVGSAGCGRWSRRLRCWS